MSADDAMEQVAAMFPAIVPDGGIAEVRIPRPYDRRLGVQSGYFNNAHEFTTAIAPYIRETLAEGVYMTLNPPLPALLSRAANRLRSNAANVTKDSEIQYLRNLSIDIDPVRPSGISATDAERQAALDTGAQIVAYLSDDGWPLPIIDGSSGNGGMLVYRLPDLPNTLDNAAMLKGVLERLADLFNSEAVTIDTGVATPAHLVKVVGTIAAKGDHTDERPFRRAQAVIRGC